MARIAAEVDKQYHELKKAKQKTLSHKSKDTPLKYVPTEWKLQQNKDGRWVIHAMETDHAAVHNLQRGTTFAALFATYFSPTLLTTAMERLNTIKDDELQTRIPLLTNHRVKYKLPSQPPFETNLNLALLYRYYAVRLYMQFTAPKPPRGETKNKDSPEEQAINQAIHDLHCHYLGFQSFKRLHNNFLITYEMMDAISEVCEKQVTLGESICLDEKLTHFSGASPFLRCVPKKPVKKGHWITLIATQLRFSDAPYIVRFVPVTTSKARFETTPIVDLVQTAIDVVKRGKKNTIIVMDSYYTSRASRERLFEAKVRYIAATTRGRFEKIFENLVPRVNKPGTYSCKFNKSRNELAVHFQHEKGTIGKKYLLTTAFRRNNGEEQLCAPVSAEYGKLFGVCDRFNHAMAKRSWPFRRGNYLRSLDDYFFTALVTNIHSLLQEYDKPRYSNMSLAQVSLLTRLL
jgi:hypothetical protein